MTSCFIMQLVITDKCKKLELSLEQTQETSSKCYQEESILFIFCIYSSVYIKEKKNLCLKAETTHTHTSSSFLYRLISKFIWRTEHNSGCQRQDTMMHQRFDFLITDKCSEKHCVLKNLRVTWRGLNICPWSKHQVLWGQKNKKVTIIFWLLQSYNKNQIRIIQEHTRAF